MYQTQFIEVLFHFKNDPLQDFSKQKDEVNQKTRLWERSIKKFLDFGKKKH